MGLSLRWGDNSWVDKALFRWNPVAINCPHPEIEADDALSASSENVLSPRVPAAGPLARMLRLSIANMMITSSTSAMARPSPRRRRSSRLQSVCSE
jgi:hypothetical protein